METRVTGDPAVQGPASIEGVPPELNTFETVVADLTHRCNMACANCYVPNRNIPDMDIDRLEACLAALPQRVNVRLIGAEPTMRRDLPGIVSMVRRRGHRPVLATNGLRLARGAYAQRLAEAGLRHVHISLNGVDDDGWYEKIDGLRCAQKKLQAVENAVGLGMTVNTGTILVRGVNEAAVERMFRLFTETIRPRGVTLRFKNIGALGRFDETGEADNLSMAEMEALCAQTLGLDAASLLDLARDRGHVEANSRIFPADRETRPGRGIWFKITDWQVSGGGCVDPGSVRRGRITEDFRIAPFFEHVKANEGGY